MTFVVDFVRSVCDVRRSSFTAESAEAAEEFICRGETRIDADTPHHRGTERTEKEVIGRPASLWSTLFPSNGNASCLGLFVKGFRLSVESEFRNSVFVGWSLHR